jgi:hypothetical protein
MYAITLLALMTVSSSLPQQFPLDDVIIIEHDTEIVLTSINTIERRERIVSTPLTLGGREDFSDIRIPYFAPMQKLEIHLCRTTRSDGSTIDAEPHAFVPVTPHGYGNAPDFIGFKEMVISPPGVEEGSITELEYTIIDSISRYPWWEQSILVGIRHPVLERTIRIEHPKEISLYWKSIHVNTDTHSRDSTSVQWAFKNLPAYPTGGLGSLTTTLVPRLDITTCPSWEAAANWVFSELISGRMLPAEAADSLSNELESAITTEDTLRSIHRVVEMFTGLVPTSDLRFRHPRSLLRILETGYADGWEYLAFSATALRYCNIEAIPCLIGPPMRDERPPLLAPLNSYWLRISGQEQYWLGTAGLRAWPVRYGEFSFLPIVEREGDVINEAGTGVMTGELRCKIMAEAEDSLSIRGEVLIATSLVPATRNAGSPGSWLSNRLESLVDSLENITITVLEAHDKEARYVFSGACNIGDVTAIHLNFEDIFGSEWVPPRTTSYSVPPRIPVVIPLSVDLSMDIRIRPDESWHVIPPSDETSVHSIISYGSSVTVDPDEIRVTRDISLGAGVYDDEKIKELRKMMSVEGRIAGRNAYILR